MRLRPRHPARRGSPCSCWTGSRRSSTGTASDRGRCARRGSGTAAGRTSPSCSSGEASASCCAGPPRPPLPPSAHDMVREARLQLALAPQGIRLPPILAVCEDEGVLGVPFYVMALPRRPRRHRPAAAGLDDPAARRRLGDELVDALVEIHAADVSDPALAAFARPGQLPRAAGAPLLAALGDQRRRARSPTSTRSARGSPTSCREPLPDDRRPRRLPARQPDGRAGASPTASRPSSTGRWARSAIPAPTSATCSRRTRSRAAARARSASRRSRRSRAFRRKTELVARYEERSGREVGPLGWFEALALWKAAVFCEAIYGRYVTRRARRGGRAGRGVRACGPADGRDRPRQARGVAFAS